MEIKEIYEKLCESIKNMLEKGVWCEIKVIDEVTNELENYESSMKGDEKLIHDRILRILSLIYLCFTISWKNQIKSCPPEIWEKFDEKTSFAFLDAFENFSKDSYKQNLSSKSLSTFANVFTPLRNFITPSSNLMNIGDDEFETVDNGLEHFMQCYDENSELSKWISEEFENADFSKINDENHIFIDEIIEWISLLKNPEEFNSFVNEKVLEYFYQYYLSGFKNEIEFCDFVKKCDEDNLTSYDSKKLSRLIQFFNNFFHLGLSLDFLVYKSAFEKDFKLEKVDFDMLKGLNENLKNEKWICACIYQSLKKMKDSEFNKIFNDNDKIPISLIDSYKESLEKYNLTSPTFEFIDSIEKSTPYLISEQGECKNFLEKEVFYVALWDLCSNFPKKEKDDYIKKFFDAFTTDCTDRKIISILNEIAEKIEIIKKNPFSDFVFSDLEKGEISLKSVLSKAIYTIKNYSSMANGFIVNEMNFIDKQQKSILNCLTDSSKFLSKSDAENEWKIKEKNRERLRELDCGINIEFRQYIPHFNEDVLYIDRNMKCYFFCEPDKKFSYTVNQIGSEKKNNVRYYIKYDEDYRTSNKNNLENIYLCLIRNIETHFSLHHSVDALLSDNYSKKHFFETFIDILMHLDTLEKNTNETNQKAAIWYISKSFIGIFSDMALQIFEEKDVIEKTLIPLFYEEKENLWQIKESMLEKIEEIKFQKIKLYVKNALIETLNFLYGIEKDFLEKNKFNVIFYLIYLSFAFYNEQKNIKKKL